MIYTLTKHQSSKLSELIKLINEPIAYSNTHYKLINFIGSAGVGKTSTIVKLLESVSYLLTFKPKVLIAAPTHKALQVITEKVIANKHIKCFIDFKTIHQELGMKQIINQDTGEISFVPNTSKAFKGGFKNYNLVIIDESSMLGKGIVNNIIETLKYKCKEPYNKTIIIFVSDEKQLPPIGEVCSPIYKLTYIPTIELTEIVRQTENNPIIHLSNNIKEFKYSNASNYNTTSKEGIIHTSDFSKIIDKLIESNGSNKYKYLAYTNSTVDAVNNYVRCKLNNTDSPDLIYPNEIIVLRKPTDKFRTNEEVKVTSVHSFKSTKGTLHANLKNNTIMYFPQDLELLRLEIQSLKDKTIIEPVYTFKNDNVKYQINLWFKSLKQECINKNYDWEDYYDKLNSFISFKHNHAWTIHISQGSTIENAILDRQDILRNKNHSELTKLIYTAITRASKSLIIYN